VLIPVVSASCGGIFMQDILNLASTCFVAGKYYTSAPGKTVVMGSAKFDGLLVKIGLMTDPRTMSNVGFLSGPLNLEESRTLLEMTEEQLTDNLKQNPLASGVCEIMYTVSDNSVTGHLGCVPEGAGGGAASVDDLVRTILLALRVVSPVSSWHSDWGRHGKTYRRHVTLFVRHVNTISSGVPSIRCEHTGTTRK
jgi:hypothetical protein